MKKMWVKKDNIYYKPFYKQKVKLTLCGVILMGIIFFVYQFIYMSQLVDSNNTATKLAAISRTSQLDDNNNNKVIDIQEKQIVR